MQIKILLIIYRRVFGYCYFPLGFYFCFYKLDILSYQVKKSYQVENFKSKFRV